MALTTTKAAAAAMTVKPRILVRFCHKARPNPRISASPSAAIGTAAGAGATVDFTFLRKNIPTPDAPLYGINVMTTYYGCYRVNRRRMAANG